MTELIAVLSLGALMVAWYGLQRLTGHSDPPVCGRADRECGSCEERTGAAGVAAGAGSRSPER